MAKLGAQVVAIDASKVFLERAKARAIEYEDRIQYALMDATDRDQF
jgi:2-polyprenyl-3-methyl-5-hydroxy-6-metoxy-1,4-benzoquinol methylase